MHYAALGHADCCEVLINANADVNHANLDFQNTPLHIASGNGYIDCCQLLLRAGANPLALNVRLLYTTTNPRPHGTHSEPTQLDSETPRHVAMYFIREEILESNPVYFESLWARIDALLSMDLAVIYSLLISKIPNHHPRPRSSLLRMLPKEILQQVVMCAGLKILLH